jgi:hypothetical protein
MALIINLFNKCLVKVHIKTPKSRHTGTYKLDNKEIM